MSTTTSSISGGDNGPGAPQSLHYRNSNNGARGRNKQSLPVANTSGRLRELQRERWINSRRRRRRRRQRPRATEELRGVSPRQILRLRLPKGPPQTAQEGMQETRRRTEGRTAVRTGSREVRRRLLPALHADNTLAGWRALIRQRLLHEESLRRLYNGS